jgi:hypothetical protein
MEMRSYNAERAGYLGAENACCHPPLSCRNGWKNCEKNVPGSWRILTVLFLT